MGNDSDGANCQKTASAPRSRFNGPSWSKACFFKGLPLCPCTNARNQSLSALASFATTSNCAGEMVQLIDLISSSVRSPACSIQHRKSTPVPIHSTISSTGVAIELRKSKAGAPPINIGGGNVLAPFTWILSGFLAWDKDHSVRFVITCQKGFDRLVSCWYNQVGQM